MREYEKGFLGHVQRMLDYKRAARRGCLKSITVAVTEKTARRRLRIAAGDPIVYEGIELKCVGTRAWRLKRQAEPVQESI